jgi:hypothetical protein
MGGPERAAIGTSGSQSASQHETAGSGPHIKPAPAFATTNDKPTDHEDHDLRLEY